MSGSTVERSEIITNCGAVDVRSGGGVLKTVRHMDVPVDRRTQLRLKNTPTRPGGDGLDTKTLLYIDLIDLAATD
jgi:hypothetical protein